MTDDYNSLFEHYGMASAEWDAERERLQAKIEQLQTALESAKHIVVDWYVNKPHLLNLPYEHQVAAEVDAVCPLAGPNDFTVKQYVEAHTGKTWYSEPVETDDQQAEDEQDFRQTVDGELRRRQWEL